jgi:DNA polymerase-3 subunit alpha
MDRAEDGQFATIVGMVSKITPKVDRNGGNMAFVEISDVNATIEVVFFSRSYEKVRSYIVIDQVLMVRGKIQDREGVKKMLGNDVMPVEIMRDKQTEGLELRLDYAAARNGLMEKLAGVLKSEPGEKPVSLVIPTVERESELRVDLGKSVRVKLTDNLIKNLHRTPGVIRVQFKLAEDDQ